MEFTNEFRVPADVDKTFATLLDLERVAPCMPGATLDDVDGDTYTGRVKIKVGPIQVLYRGTAQVMNVDEEARSASIRAKGKETRGAGTAEANVTATLREDGGETVVTVVTDINVTGKPAQFGRGVMADVGEQIIGQFAERLRAMLLSGDSEARSPAHSPGNGIASTTALADVRPAARTSTPGEEEALDLMAVAGPAALKRLAPVLAVAALALIVWLSRRR